MHDVGAGRLDQLVLKPVDGSGGKGIVIGPRADERTLEELRGSGRGRPAGLDRAAADRAVHLADPDRRADAPRHVDLRPFAVNDGDNVWVLPGGLTRVALPEGELVVNSSQGGGSKDTWVLAAAASRPPSTRTTASAPGRDRRRPACWPPAERLACATRSSSSNRGRNHEREQAPC